MDRMKDSSKTSAEWKKGVKDIDITEWQLLQESKN